ncbi:MAG: serine hydrolase [Saprospiraceae bacterium]|nr:serine hydrolase [Saprospiraceae bacterium]
MKNSILNTALYTISALLLISFSSCEKDIETLETIDQPVDLSTRGPGDIAAYTIDVKKFATLIEDNYKNQVSGLSYVIYNNNQIYYNGTGGKGWARRPVDAPQVAHSAQQRQGIASTTKYATALVVAKMLEKNGKTLDEKIHPYFPTNWKPHADFKKITFRQLLAHETGLFKYGNKYAHVKRTVEGGIDIAEYNNKVRDYDNINYFLPHYIIPYMIGKLENPNYLAQLKTLESDTNKLKDNLAIAFLNSFRNLVFKPAGLKYWDKVSFSAWNNNGPMNPENGNKFYTSLNMSEKGSNKSDGNYGSGPGGLYISASEYGQVISAAVQGKIVSKSMYQIMRQERLGFDWTGSWSKGNYYAKNGAAGSKEMLIDFGTLQLYVMTNCNLSDLHTNLNFYVNALNSCVK